MLPDPASLGAQSAPKRTLRVLAGVPPTLLQSDSYSKLTTLV